MSGSDQPPAFPPPGAPEPSEPEPTRPLAPGPVWGSRPPGGPETAGVGSTGSSGYLPPGVPDMGIPNYMPASHQPRRGAQPPGPPSYPGAGSAPLAAHRPGALPLRPLGLGDMYDAAFRIIRYNPKATVGSAVLVGVICMAIPVLATLLLTFAIDISYDPTSTSGSATPSTDELVVLVGTYGSLVLGAVLQSFGLVFVTGMVTHVTAAAAIGRRLSIGEAWAATHGRRWRLVGLSLLLGLISLLIVGGYALLWVLLVAANAPIGLLVVFGLVSVPLLVVVLCLFWTRVYLLAVPALMLEPIGVMGSLGRSYQLSARQFWRIFGIALLTVVVTSVAGNLLSMPVSLVGQFGALALPTQYVMLAIILTSSLAQVLSTAFTAPFTAAVTALQYVDQRMRKEGYDVTLMTQAGITAA